MLTNVGLQTSGTNPGKERVSMIGVVSRVAQNAGTVAEALEYINTIDVYSIGNVSATNWDYAFMIGAETDRDMMEAVHKADWYHEMQDYQYSYRDKEGKIHFVNKDGNLPIDFRSEFVARFLEDEECIYEFQ